MVATQSRQLRITSVGPDTWSRRKDATELWEESIVEMRMVKMSGKISYIKQFNAKPTNAQV